MKHAVFPGVEGVPQGVEISFHSRYLNHRWPFGDTAAIGECLATRTPPPDDSPPRPSPGPGVASPRQSTKGMTLPASRTGRRGFCLPVFVFLLLSGGPCTTLAQAQPPGLPAEKNILILHAHEANVPIFEKTDKGLSTALQSGGVPTRNQFFEYLDLRRNPSAEHRKLLVEQMRVRYSHRKFDMIITLFPEALHFVLHEDRTLFAGVPILALYLPLGIEPPTADRRIILHSVTLDMIGTLESALALVPSAKRVYVVSGTDEIDRKYEDQARRDFKKWEGRLEFRYLSHMRLEEMLATISSAPPETVIFFISLITDIAGKSYTSRDVVQRLSEISPIPIFGLYDSLLGYGIAGGLLASFEDTGTRAGQATLQLLGAAHGPDQVSTVLDVPAVPMFDWRQLKHWGLSVDALPPGSIVLNREFTLWEQYRWQAIGAIVLLAAQGMLILALLVYRQRRRKAEETLRENEERLRLAMSAGELSVWSWDIPRDGIRVSELVGGMSAETPTAEIPYKDALAIVHPEDRERVDAILQEALRTGKDCEIEYRIPQQDGTVQWISSRGGCTYDRAGTPLRMTGVFHDITEHKRSELALQESERRFRRMTDAAHMMVWMSGPDQGCIYFNRSWLDFTGRRLEQEVGHGWAEGVHPEDLERIVGAYSRAFDAHKAFQLEYRLRRYDGEYRWIIDVGTPLYEDDGRFCGYLGSCLDITDRKRAEEEGQLLAAVVESSHDAIYSLGPDDRITSWNPGAEQLFGYAAAEVKGQPVWFLVPLESHEATMRALKKVRAGEPVSDFETVRRRKDGTDIQVSIAGAPIRSADGTIVGVSTTIRDVTERKRAEEEADRLRRELAHMSRVTMMGELTASLAHELNQPLTAIVTNAHAGERYLAASVPPLGEVAEILADVAADAQRAGETIRRMRSLLKKDTTRFGPLDVNEVIREVVALTQTDALIRHQPIELSLAPDLPPVRGDRVQLQQVLLNLVLNGMEAMGAAAPAARRLDIQTLRAGPAVHVGVHDQGPGIPPDKLETVFESFFTTKASGLGLGLAISRSIVEAHGGRIWAANHPECGATFWFSVPL
jgi:two-component system, LuxR family, sensor kinase FixL